MPCNSDYMKASGWEVAMSQVACLLDELDGKPINDSHWRGYHPLAYNRGLSDGERDKMVAKLCSRLQKIDVTKQSLEMQMWWRDHQKADKERIAREAQEKAQSESRELALKKLTPYERKLLGID